MVLGAEQAHARLAEAMRTGLVLSLGERYRFLHDRVQEAAYLLIPQEQRAAIHLKIGRLLVSQMAKEQVNEHVFEIVNQLNQGVALMLDPGEKEALCLLNFRAGTKAKSAVAYASARSYLAQATALLPPDAWSVRYADTFEIFIEQFECEYLVGAFASADRLFEVILDHAQSNLDRARVYCLSMRLYQLSGRYDEALRVALEALRFFDVAFPDTNEELMAVLQAENQEILVSLRGRSIASLVDAPVAGDRDVRAIIGLLADAMPIAYSVRPFMFPVLVVKALNFSLRYGNTEESCFAYTCYGVMQVSIFGDIPSAVHLGLHADPAKQVVLDELQRRYPPTAGSSQPAAVVISTGQPMLFPTVSSF